jgi:hypothetical protein
MSCNLRELRSLQQKRQKPRAPVALGKKPRCDVRKLIVEPDLPESDHRRICTASAKLTRDEFRQLELRAARAGKRVGDWCRDVILRELSGHDLADVLLAEVLGVRMVLLNVLGPLARGELVSEETFQKILATVDALKMKRALERMSEERATEKGA